MKPDYRAGDFREPDFSELVPDPVARGLGVTYGVVTSARPLRVWFDGASSPLDATLHATCKVQVGDRVRVSVEGTRRVVVGVIGGEPENTINVSGVAYQASGSLWVTPTSWVRQDPPIYWTTVSFPRPYVPPAGWGFNVYLLSSSGVGFVSVVDRGLGGPSVSFRLLQLHNANLYSLLVGWQLIRA